MILPPSIDRWPAEWKELFHERAAIMQFEGGMLQSVAEKEAEKDIRKLVERGQ